MPTKPVRVQREKEKPGKKSVVAYFDPELFLNSIRELGLKFRWSRAVQCPCQLNTDTDQWDPTCGLCGGDGWWYVNPEGETERHTGPVSNAASARNYIDLSCAFSQGGANPKNTETFGNFVHGKATLVVQNQCRVGFRDRFVGLQQQMAHTELLTRNAAVPLVPIGKGSRPTVTQRAAMRYEPVAINLIATATTRYWEGTDWVLTDPRATEPRKVQWLAGRGPSDGELYTVHYVCRPVWIVNSATFAVQYLKGPAEGIRGVVEPRALPTAFEVMLDFLVQATGT